MVAERIDGEKTCVLDILVGYALGIVRFWMVSWMVYWIRFPLTVAAGGNK